MYRSILASLSALALVRGQQIGTNTAETHPSLSISKCTAGGSCTSSTQSIVLDANWRWVHTTSGYTNCYTGNEWNATICPDATTCAQNCALDGADYSGTYGISTTGDSLTLGFVTKGSTGTANVGSRVYLLEDSKTYQTFNLLNQEFTFDVDVSNLPCGLNGALYFSQMDADGGVKRFSTNKAGAQYGTGYCDSQCPQDLKFIDGIANVKGWSPSSSDPNSGTGSMGTCCSEMDIWEANSNAAAYTPHPCSVDEQTMCTAGGNCTTTCDQAGCDFNSYRMGDRGFYGAGLTVDTKSKFTVVTQFVTSDNTATGTLSQINRFYVQNGKVIPNSMTNFTGITQTNAISETFCKQQKSVFGDTDAFDTYGGLSKMGQAFADGMVLVMSIWDDQKANCLWLDSEYPVGGDASSPGVARGPCPTNSGVPAAVESQYPGSSVTFSNIKYGPINSTFTGGSSSGNGSGSGSGSTPTSTVTGTGPSSSPSGGTVAMYGQCGGIGYTGPTTCVAGATCHVLNSYYSQCY